ncbi:rhomboid family intramembrane serine protease [Balneolales bacterium ANBcel1]|nr:rhomboid family intramembrane serine protease [Balneolales bacterium ANBcel1]
MAFSDPTLTIRKMTALLLLLLTVIITFMAWYAIPQWQYRGMLKPYEAWREGKWHQLVTSGFLHADGSHLLVNMFVFFFFGPTLEQEIGTGLFLPLYATALVASSLPTLIIERNNPRYASLGASGAVEAVLFGYIVMFPLNKIYIIFIPIGIPAIIFGGLFLLYSYFESRRRRDNVNHVAHIAGALYGAVYTLLLVPDAFSRFLGHFGF